MIDRNHPLPIAHQAKIVGISRGTVYYVPRPISEAELALMRRIDELHLDYPFMGARGERAPFWIGVAVVAVTGWTAPTH